MPCEVLIDDGQLRKIAGWVVGNPQYDQSAIIVWRRARAAVAIRCCKNFFRDFLSRISLRESRKKRGQTLRAELFQLGIFGFEDTVGSEKDDVTRSQFDGCLIVLGIGNETERDAFKTDGLHTAVADEKRIGTAGIGESEAARGPIVRREKHRNEARFEPRVMQTAIESR